MSEISNPRGMPDWAAINENKELKKKLVLERITRHCTPDSNIEAFRKIAQSLKTGDSLEIEILTGGLANYTYKIYLSQSPEVSLFAKLSFAYTQLFPDKPCPLLRTENEFYMMEKFSSLAPGCVATPYICEDVDDMKLLVCQWCPADEQFSNQFIDGSVDDRCMTRLATAIEALHSTDFDPNFNESLRPFLESLNAIIESVFQEYNQPNGDRATAVGYSYDQKTWDAITKTFEQEGERRDCLCHGDLHTFNILVEKKPDVASLEQFAPNGAVMVCDWEFALPGSCSKDIGWTRPFPLACVLSHAINGHKDVANSIVNSMDAFWKAYAAAARKHGKDEAYLSGIFKKSLAWTGLMLLGFAKLGIHTNFCPIDQDNTDHMEKLKESLGVLGVTFIRFILDDYEPDSSLTKIEDIFRRTVEKEIAVLLAVTRPRPRGRRSSLLRDMGRRVSDSNLFLEKYTRESFTKRSSCIQFDGSIILEQ